MWQHHYKIAFVYSLFAYFLFFPMFQGSWTDFYVPSIRPQATKILQIASSAYAALKPKKISASPPITSPVTHWEPASVATVQDRVEQAPSVPELNAKPLELRELPPQPIVSSPKLIEPPAIEPSIPPSPSLAVKPVEIPPLVVPTPTAELATQQAAFSLSRPPPEKELSHKMRYPVPKRVILSHDGSYGDDSGVGYGADYSTLGLFLAPDYSVGTLYPLLDLRAHRFDNDTYAFNVGVGGRYIPASNTFCEIFGFNVFYDWRQGFLNQYNQFGVGLEILGRRWDFRANGYFPVGAKSFRYTCVYNDYIGDYVIVNEKQEITTYGFNAEVGWLAVASKNFLLYFAAGPYYLTTNKSCCFGFQPIRGGRIRARPQYKDYFAVDVSFSHDSTFNTVWQTTFIVSLPLYEITQQNEKPCRLTDRQIYQPIERFEVMSLGTSNCWWQNY